MALAIGTKRIWDYWAPKYDRIWGFQRFSLRPTRSFVHRHIKKLTLSPTKILDIGCGVGELSFELSSHYSDAQIMAVDYSEGMISRAKKDFHAPNITHIHGSLQDIPPDQKFDLIISTHSFPYFPDKHLAARNMYHLLAPHGRLMVIQGNTNNVYDFIWLSLVKLGVSKAQFLPVNTVKEILETSGFKIETVKSVERALLIPSIYMVEGVKGGTA